MATGNVIVTVVDVGQGQCTFVEIYNTASTPVLIYTLLFDCGSDKKSTQTDTNLQYIVDRVSAMSTPTFNCIFFSHSDKDHISLTYDLLQKFPSSKKPAINYVWYGGAWDKYTKNKFNILNYLVSQSYCSASNMKSTGSNYTDYNKTSRTFTDYLWKILDDSVVVYAIASNVLSDDPDWDDQDLSVDGKTAEALNRVSMVCGLYAAGASYVICGDATNKTMAAINTLCDSSTTVFNNNKMTTLPHHGSRATGFAVKSSESASFAAILVVSSFSSNMKSKTLTASAYAKHRHPSLQLMTYFPPTVTTPVLRDPRLKQKNSHRVTANIDIDLGTGAGFTIIRGWDYTFETQTNMFSTYYWDGTATFSYNIGAFSTASASEGLVSPTVINSFACWQSILSTSGMAVMSGYANLSLPLSAFTDGPTTAVATEETAAATTQPAIEALPAGGSVFQPLPAGGSGPDSRPSPGLQTSAASPASPAKTIPQPVVRIRSKNTRVRPPAQSARQFQTRIKQYS